MFYNKGKNKQVVYQKINDTKALFNIDYFYKKLKQSDDLIGRFSQDSVFKDLPILQQDHYCIKAQNFLEFSQTYEREVLISVYNKIDFSDINENEIIESLNKYISKPQIISEKIKKIEEIYFFDCKFVYLDSDALLKSAGSGLPINVFFRNCFISELIYGSHSYPSDKFINCHISYFSQSLSSHTKEFFNIKHNTIINLITNHPNLKFSNIDLCIHYHSNLENTTFEFDNVSFKYNHKILNSLPKEAYSGYWNTFNHLSTLKSLKSEKGVIEKYINYFKSRDPSLSKLAKIVKKLLYWYHEGFTNALKPFTTTTIIFFINYFVLYFGLEKKEYAMTLSFNFVKLYREVIFNNFHFTFFTDINIWKVILFITEPFFFLSTLTLVLTLRKKFSFKLDT